MFGGLVKIGTIKIQAIKIQALKTACATGGATSVGLVYFNIKNYSSDYIEFLNRAGDNLDTSYKINDISL